MNKKNKTIFISILSLFVVAFGSVVLAVDDINFTPQVTIPNSDFMAYQEKLVADDGSLICDYIVAIYKYAIAVVGVFAVVAMAIGGTMWILAAGNQTRVSDGKSWVMGGLLGLILALGSFIILSTISDELVTCNLNTIQKIQKINDPAVPSRSFGQQYNIQGRKGKQAAKHLDSSGHYYCCVIKGEIEGSGTFSDTLVMRTATYESNVLTEAQAECEKFYDQFEFSGNSTDLSGTVLSAAKGQATNFIPVIGIPLSLYYRIKSIIEGVSVLSGKGVIMKFEDWKENNTVSAPANLDDLPKSSAAVYDGKCWDLPQMKNINTEPDSADYCKTRDQGDSCITGTGDWGYCYASLCKKCKTYCQKCDNGADYECPNQGKNPLTDGVAGVVCGNEVYKGWGTNSSDCDEQTINGQDVWVCDIEYRNDGQPEHCSSFTQ